MKPVDSAKQTGDPATGTSGRRRRNLLAAAAACFVAGVIFSHRVEPGVRVEQSTLAADIPALRFVPLNQGPHPVALLAHGITASKESLFRFSEALAIAGFTCVSIDLPGHGASPRPFSGDEVVRAIDQAAGALGRVDVFIGHSMGAGAGAEAVREGGLNPRLFVAVGASPNLGEHGPPLLLLDGQFEELHSPALLKARKDANVVISPWSDHALAPFDPRLVIAGVDAACAAAGKSPPAAPTRWRWRLAGVVLGMFGALAVCFNLPSFPRPWVRARGPSVALIAITAIMLTLNIWLGTMPHLRRVPVQLAFMMATWLVLVVLGKLRLPRWSLAAAGAGLTIGCILAGVCAAADSASGSRHGFHFVALILGLNTLLLFMGTSLGWIASRGGCRPDGDFAMAIFVGYAVGQWIPLPATGFLQVLL